jgi:hypothetical protein
MAEPAIRSIIRVFAFQEKQAMLKLVPAIFMIALALAFRTEAAEPKIPIIHSTDLCHPHDDPDDHYDLACLFALREFDIKGIVLDLGEHQATRPGRPPVEQMMHITGRKAPYAFGLDKPLRSLDDRAYYDKPLGGKALADAEKFQGGVRLLLELLRNSSEKVLIHCAGSCRDVAAAFNREPGLFREKVKAIYVEAGNGPGGEQNEYNVMLSPFAYLRLLESGLPIYWCPCFGRDGYATFYGADQPMVVGACTRPVQNYFVYCLSKLNEDPIAFVDSGPHPLPTGQRAMWCTAPMLHAAGRKIYQRGPDDFVALRPQNAEKAGLARKAVDAFQFVPVRVSSERLPGVADKPGQPLNLKLASTLNPTQPTTVRIFRATDPRYGKILASCLKNLLAEVGR